LTQLQRLDLGPQILLGLAEAGLKPAEKFVVLAFRKSEVIIGELTVFLFQFTLYLVPVALDIQFRAHTPLSIHEWQVDVSYFEWDTRIARQGDDLLGKGRNDVSNSSKILMTSWAYRFMVFMFILALIAYVGVLILLIL
jgi:hypothetical protein